MSQKNKKNQNVKKGVKKIPLTPEESAKRTRRIVITVVAIILALAIIFGAVLGIITAVRNASYVMKLDRVGIDEGVASFLISEFKCGYISGYNGASDTDEFWSQPRPTGNEGDLFNYEAEIYLREIVAANALFDKYATLSREDKEKIEFAVQEVLDFKASGSKKIFNEKTKAMGFDYDDFKKGNEMIYKAYIVFNAVFGVNGANMPTMFGDWCESFFAAKYIRAKILIIRTENTFEFDESNQPKKDGEGNYVTRPLTDAEKEERADYIAELDSLANTLKENPASVISRNRFNALLSEIANKYNENVTSGVENGYYLMYDYNGDVNEKISSEYTSKMGMEHIIEAAYSLEVGEIYVYENGAATAEDESGNSFAYKCYVYRMEKEDDAYTKSSLSHFFTDFNALAGYYLYVDMMKTKKDEVVLKKKWDNINPVTIPVNTDLYVREF